MEFKDDKFITYIYSEKKRLIGSYYIENVTPTINRFHISVYDSITENFYSIGSVSNLNAVKEEFRHYDA